MDDPKNKEAPNAIIFFLSSVLNFMSNTLQI